jgi:hypothetical protein
MAAAMGLAAGSAQAVTIYGINNLGELQFPGNVGDQLVRFDSANPLGTVVNVGHTGVGSTGFAGLDFHPNGNLYGVAGFVATGGPPGNVNNFYSVNTNTGAASLIGNLGLPTGFAAADMSYNPVTGNMQVLANNNVVGAGRIVRLYNVNVGTGAATLIGDVTGLPIPGQTDQLQIGLATNAAGTNFLHDLVSDRMYRLTGLAATPLSVGTMGFLTNFSQGMTIDWAGDDTWYLASWEVTAGNQSRIRTMDQLTGLSTAILTTWPLGPGSPTLPRYELGDIAAVIPEPATAGTSLLSLFAAEFVLRRRRRRVA